MPEGGKKLDFLKDLHSQKYFMKKKVLGGVDISFVSERRHTVCNPPELQIYAFMSTGNMKMAVEGRTQQQKEEKGLKEKTSATCD